MSIDFKPLVLQCETNPLRERFVCSNASINVNAYQSKPESSVTISVTKKSPIWCDHGIDGGILRLIHRLDEQDADLAHPRGRGGKSGGGAGRRFGTV